MTGFASKVTFLEGLVWGSGAGIRGVVSAAASVWSSMVVYCIGDEGVFAGGSWGIPASLRMRFRRLMVYAVGGYGGSDEGGEISMARKGM